MGAPGTYGRALWRFYPHQYIDYSESSALRNRLASSSKMTIDISPSDSRSAARKSQRVRTRHCVGSEAITEAVRRPSSSRASSPKKSVAKGSKAITRGRQPQDPRGNQAIDHTNEIANAVAVSVGKTARVNLVEHGFLPPIGVCHLIFRRNVGFSC